MANNPPEASLRRALELIEEAAACLQALRLCGSAGKAYALIWTARQEARQRLRVDLLQRQKSSGIA